jgi:hypothetical protein
MGGDSKNETAGTGQGEQIRTARTGQLELDCQKETARTGQDSKNKTARTGN